MLLGRMRYTQSLQAEEHTSAVRGKSNCLAGPIERSNAKALIKQSINIFPLWGYPGRPFFPAAGVEFSLRVGVFPGEIYGGPVRSKGHHIGKRIDKISAGDYETRPSH